MSLLFDIYKTDPDKLSPEQAISAL